MYPCGHPFHTDYPAKTPDPPDAERIVGELLESANAEWAAIGYPRIGPQLHRAAARIGELEAGEEIYKRELTQMGQLRKRAEQAEARGCEWEIRALEAERQCDEARRECMAIANNHGPGCLHAHRSCADEIARQIRALGETDGE